MPISLENIANDVATVTFKYNGLDVTVRYKPNLVNDGLLARLDSTYSERNKALVEILIGWDVFEDTAQTIPFAITEEHLALLNTRMKNSLVQAIAEDMRPN